MIIKCKTNNPSDVELLDDDGVPLNIYVKRLKIVIDPEKPIMASLEVLVEEIELLDCMVDTIVKYKK